MVMFILFPTFRQDHPWFADAILRVGKQWQSLGRTHQALQSYRWAMSESPFQACFNDKDTGDRKFK